jgi:hypothetical protein
MSQQLLVPMEVEGVLQARDAEDWVYKGEGAANLILSYTGSSPSMVCTDLVPSMSSFAWCAVDFGALLLLPARMCLFQPGT